VPVDYVVDTIYVLSLHPDAANKTFHIIDPNPLSVRKVYELLAEKSGKRKPQRFQFSTGLAKVLLKIPGLEKLSRKHRQAIDYINTMSIYNDANTSKLLRGSNLMCPSFETYLDNLIDYVRNTLEAQRRQEEQASDPLA